MIIENLNIIKTKLIINLAKRLTEKQKKQIIELFEDGKH